MKNNYRNNKRTYFRSLLLAFVLMLTNFSICSATTYGTNLVVNGDGSSTTGWTNSDVTNFMSYNAPPFSSVNGGNIFDYYPGGSGSTATLVQTIDISDKTSDISGNGVKAVLNGEVIKHLIGDIARITLDQLDAGSSILATTSIESDIASSQGGLNDGTNTWQSKSVTIPKLNASTVKLRITLTAHVTGANGSEYVEFDGIELILSLLTPPTITTQAVSNIASTTATGNGNITALGTLNPTAYGVCWNTVGSPTTSDSKVDNGAASATGAFTASMTGLSANTTYYVQAYATNAAGTSYGGVVSFKTDALPTVTSVAVPINKTYSVGQNLDFTVSFNKAITVVTTGGTPFIALTLNTGVTVNATYISGSGTSALVFRYTVALGNADGDGVSVGSLSANGGTLKDAAGNSATLTLNSVGSTSAVLVDGVKPTATIGMSDAALRVGETSTVTFTFSEAVTGFTNADLTVANGTLSAVSSADGSITWTATFTPAASVTDATNVIALNNTGFTDLAGNAGTGTTTSLDYTIDTTRPTATIGMSDATLKIGETSTLTFTFSEAVTGFSNADLTVANGTLSAVSSADGSITWTATFTPAASVTDATNVIALDNTGFTDAAGNAGTGTTTSLNYTIDTTRPTATIGMSDADLKAGETSTVTFTFSKAVTVFTTADLTVANGSVTGLSTGDGGITWTATFTPSASVTDATNIITLDNTGVSDLAGNAGSGTTTSGNYTIDTEYPTVTISSTTSDITNANPIQGTVTFSKSVSGFIASDITVTNGTVAAFSGNGAVYAFDITPSGQGLTTIAIAAGVAQDAAGNNNTAATSLNRTFDNVASVISGVVSNGIYTSAQSPTFTDGTATLSLNGGMAAAYLSGTPISASGNYVVTVTDAAGNSNSVSFTITISTGINEQHEISLSLYPNPCTDGFKVSGIDAPADVIITDLIGRVVLTTMVDVDGYVPVAHLKQGTYLVKVNQRVLKLIKK